MRKVYSKVSIVLIGQEYIDTLIIYSFITILRLENQDLYSFGDCKVIISFWTLTGCTLLPLQLPCGQLGWFVCKWYYVMFCCSYPYVACGVHFIWWCTYHFDWSLVMYVRVYHTVAICFAMQLRVEIIYNFAYPIILNMSFAVLSKTT